MARDGSSERHGADPGTWAHWDLILGLTEDLLPVVSDPGARISERSTLKALGKTPSLFNGRGEAVGIKGWTTKSSTGREVEDWSRDGRLGICLQTRRVRAIDIDVEDAEAARAIVEAIHAELNVRLPRRFRAGSGKCLLLFELPGDYGKRSFPVAGGVVEVLMTGQQCVVAGTHPKGARYEWEGGLPDSAPVLSAEAFEALYAGLVERFATGAAHRVDLVCSRADLDLADEEAGWLVENWETFGVDREGRRLFVSCPWAEEHSTDNGETQSTWLMRGAGGFERGHFKCLHAHCLGRGREEFLSAVGYHESGFTDLSVSEAAGSLGGNKTELLPIVYKRNRVTGVIKATINNVILACEREDVCGVRLAYDDFRDELLIAAEGDAEWRPFRDSDAVKLRRRLENKDFDPVGRELIRDAVLHVAEANAFDSAKQWLISLPAWDGVPRVESFMPRYMATADNEYTRAVGAYAWTAHVARVLDPGCKADMAIVLVGPQGQLKSSAIAAIAPQRDFFGELSLEKLDENLSRQMRGVLVAEIPELKGLNSRDSDSIRAWITKQWESWTPKFREHKTIFKRRLVLWATTNEDEFLADATGERRWLPCRVGARADAIGVERDRDQLWAEGLVLYQARGVLWQDAERLARDEHHKYKVIDSWEEHIVRWLHEPAIDGSTPVSRNEVTFSALAQEALGLDKAGIRRNDQNRILNILRKLGFESVQKATSSGNSRVWMRIGIK